MDTTRPDPTFSEIENARRRWLSAGRPVSRRAIDIHTVNPDNPFDEPCWRVDGIEQLISTNDFIAQAPSSPAPAPAQAAAPGPRPQAFNLRPPVSNPQSPVSNLPLPLLRTNGGAQARAAMDSAAVGDYADALRAGAKFPPAITYYDGQNYWLADGFHRLEAHRAAGLEEMPCIVRQGTLRDAILFSVGANTTHGLRRTNADKRRAVERLLLDEEWRQWSDAEIARRTAVDAKTVASVRTQIVATLEIPESTERLASNGRRMNVTNIGARPAPPAAPAAPSPLLPVSPSPLLPVSPSPLLPVSPSPLLPVSPSTPSTPPEAPFIPAQSLERAVGTWAITAYPTTPEQMAALFSIIVSKTQSPHWPSLLAHLETAGHPNVRVDDLRLAVNNIHANTHTAIQVARLADAKFQHDSVLTARRDRAAHVTTEIVEPAGRALANALLSSDPGAWQIVYRVVHGESAPPDLGAADLVATLAAHWLRAGLNLSLHDASDPNVIRAEITRTMMRRSVAPPWITTKEERAYVFVDLDIESVQRWFTDHASRWPETGAIGNMVGKINEIAANAAEVGGPGLPTRQAEISALNERIAQLLYAVNAIKQTLPRDNWMTGVSQIFAAADLDAAAGICRTQPACVLEYAAATCTPDSPLHAVIDQAIAEKSS